MKKILFLFLLVVTAVGCNLKQDFSFDQSPDQRIAAEVGKYSDALTTAPNGWILSVQTGNGSLYTFWCSFYQNNRVTMMGDLDQSIKIAGIPETSKKAVQSTYRLKSIQMPTLIFDTYNYIHILSDPTTEINGGVRGEGLKSEFEFEITKYDGGVFHMVGRYYRLAASMRPATNSEAVAIAKGGFEICYEKFNGLLNSDKYPNFPVITVGDNPVEVSLSARQASILYIDANKQQVDQVVPCSLDFDGATTNHSSNVVLFTPLKIGDVELTSFICDENNKYSAVDSKGVLYPVTDYGDRITPLTFGYGKAYQKLTVKAEDLTGTLVDPFLTEVYMKAKQSLYDKASKRSLNYIEMEFMFNTQTAKEYMQLTVNYSSADGKKSYNAKWKYQMTRETSPQGDIVTFTSREQTGSSNEGGNEPYLVTIPDYFCQLIYHEAYSSTWATNVKNGFDIVPKKFRLGWVKNHTASLAGSTGGFYPIEGNDVNSVCCGLLK